MLLLLIMINLKVNLEVFKFKYRDKKLNKLNKKMMILQKILY